MTREELQKQIQLLSKRRLYLMKKLSQNSENSDEDWVIEVNQLGDEISRLQEKLIYQIGPDYTNQVIDLYLDNDVSDDSEEYYYLTLHESLSTIGKVRITYSFVNSYKRDYLANIGCEIAPHYRGRHYALQSLELLKTHMKDRGLIHPIITAYPNNYASIKTIEKFGGKLIEEANEHKDWNTYQVDLLEKDFSIKK